MPFSAGNYKKTLIGVTIVLGGLVAYNYISTHHGKSAVIAATPTTPKAAKKKFWKKEETNDKELPKA
ncbi:hypothetical protein J8273_1755 [Carpediemonas membranifera]|uniref:Uncharacterized protein n=1 Tax=Carpediemonas membranifera TaxID=201153 RepID=A0A8J6BBC8_9EUKA|nr:hypothetical protein J8273_1755 [Carpediemonas membranifera]|eukprot:KAG9396737.1 hypothetical protein J8273_1755 [Carpediemonas membranifera]